VQQFVDEGAYVFITGRRQNELDKAVKQIGKNVTGVQGDVSNLEDLDRLYDTVKQQKGRIDILFANAGPEPVIEPLGMITENHFDKIFNVNVKGLLFTVQKALPLFQDGGSIILNDRLLPLLPRDLKGSVFTARPRPRYGRSHAPGQSILNNARSVSIPLVLVLSTRRAPGEQLLRRLTNSTSSC